MQYALRCPVSYGASSYLGKGWLWIGLQNFSNFPKIHRFYRNREGIKAENPETANQDFWKTWDFWQSYRNFAAQSYG